jgi:peptidoglycan/xylan/chitin deacetylase (PgdA/CDA1 family)
MSPVPVLMYHHVNNHKGDMVTITPETFEMQMHYLNKAGYKTLNTGELISHINGTLQLNEKSVMVTFDDGWIDNYVFAYPVMKKYGIKATIFLVTSWIDNAGNAGHVNDSDIPTHEESSSLLMKNKGQKVVLNWDMIREMKESGLVEFHSHTQNHMKCHHLNGNDLLEEVQQSKKRIEGRLGSDCTCLCWPMGRYNDLAVKTAEEAGYKALFTTNYGVVNENSDLFAIQRIAVKDSNVWFRKSMTIYTNAILSGLYLRLKKK